MFNSGGVTARLHMRYQYTADGMRHTSQCFNPFGTGDYFTGYQRKNYERYRPHLDSQTPITCLVNPSDPAQALIDPVPRLVILLLGSIFAILFTLVGAALLLNVRRHLPPIKPRS